MESPSGWGGVRLVPYSRASRAAGGGARRRAVRSGSERALPEREGVSVAPGTLPPHFLCLPLEDIGQHGTDKTFCVITKRSSSYFLYRFTAEDSVFLFSPWSLVRRFAIRISCHRYFELVVMTTILLNCVFLALSQPIEETEYVFLIIYTIEMIIKIIAKGFILNKYSYLRNPWNWLDFIVVLSGYITLSLQAIGVAIGNLSGLRTFRVLRALKTVSITPGLKTIVNAMLHSLGMLAEVMTLTVFCLMVFALLALQLYVGALRHKCVLDYQEGASNVSYSEHVADRASWLIDADGQPAICGNRTGARHCPAGYTCLGGVGENPNFGYTNFDSYGWALLTTFQLITLDFWEDVYNKINDSTGPTSVLFFMLVVFFGSFYLINLTLAVVAIAYEEEAATTRREQDTIRPFKVSFPSRVYSTLLALRAQGRLFKGKPRRWCSPRRVTVPLQTPRMHVPRSEALTRAPMANRVFCPGETLQEEDEDESKLECWGEAPDIVVSAGGTLRTNETSSVHVMSNDIAHRSSDQSLPCSREFWEPVCERFRRAVRRGVAWCGALRGHVASVVNERLFDLAITVCILLNTAFLAAEHHGMTARTERILRLGNLVFTGIFCLECVVKLLALGRRYFASNWNVFDFVVVVLSLADLSFETVGGLSVLRTFRLLRVVKLAQAWPTMRLLLTIIASTVGAVGNMTLVLAVIVYIFAILGVQLFGDTYTPDNFHPDPVPRWHLGDFWHSVLVVFRILCGEWVQPLWECMHAAGERRQACLPLFLGAFLMGNFLVLNLFLAMLLNSFNTQQLTQQQHDNKEKTSSDSKLLKSIRRIKGAIRRSSPGEPLFRRRWTEPGIAPVSPDRRASEGPPRPKGLKTWSPHGLAVKDFQNKSVSIPVEEPQSGSKDSTSLKTPDKKISEPPDCFPDFVYRYGCDMNGRPFYRYWKRSRKFSLHVVDHKAFEWIVLLLIFSSSIVLCFEDAFLPSKPVLKRVLEQLNLVFTACFVLEVVLKWLAHGLKQYFASLWSTMDFVIVCVSVVSVVAESAGSGLYALRAFRTLRALRPLRAISRWEGMKIVVNALMSAIPSIFNVLLVCVVFWLIFGIMGVQFFGGRFYRCVDPSGQTLPSHVTADRGECLAANQSWVNRDVNFDNVGNAYLALFQVATFEGWTEVLEHAADARGVGQQPQREANFPAYLYFVTFIICGSFFTLNLFIGVIIDNFNMLKKKYEGGIVEVFLTERQKAYYTAMLKLGRRKPQRVVPRPDSPYLRLCYDIAMSRKFEVLVFVLIVLNMASMSVEHYGQSETVTSVLETLNVFFTAVFCVEAALKVLGLRHFYFTFPWNVFDLIVIVLSVIGLIFEEALQGLVISPTLLRVVRLVRLGRILRLVRAARGIRRLLFALVLSLPALFNIGALLFLLTFVYAIIGMSLFGHVTVPESTVGGGLSQTVNFQTFSNSMVLLFRLSTSAGWNDVLDSLRTHHPSLAVPYLVSYIVVTFMVVINMYIAVILENLRREEDDDPMDVEGFYAAWAALDPGATQFVPLDRLPELLRSLEPPVLAGRADGPALAALDLPVASGGRVHCLDVLHGLVRLRLGAGLADEDAEAFRSLKRRVDERFRKTFPTRNRVEMVTTTGKMKRQEAAARVIQGAFRRRLRRSRDPPPGDDS